MCPFIRWAAGTDSIYNVVHAMNEPAQKKKIQAGCTLRKLKAFGYIRRKQNILRKKK